MSTIALRGLKSANSLLFLCLALLLIKTYHWPLISDAVLMHYVVFLEQHGMTPYRQIIDVNMPGAYLADTLVIKLFGTGVIGFRLFDYGLMAAATAAFVILAGRRNIYSGLLAGLTFSILHIADGVAQEGQRDFIMAVLLLLGYVALFAAVRRHSAALLGLFGLACGASATLKPQAALLGLLLVPATAYLVAKRKNSWPYVTCGWVGTSTPIILAAICLWRFGALTAWVHLSLGLSVYHARLARHPLTFLLAHAVPSQLLLLLIPAVIITLLTQGWRQWQQLFVLAGVAFGVLSFCLQGKAYPYHRYPLTAFLLLFVAMQIQHNLASKQLSNFQKILAWVMVAYVALWLAPTSTARALRYDWRAQPSLDQLQADLQQAGGHNLSGTIQCMDTMAGCITVLNRMQLVQATGFLYDCYFFAPEPGRVKDELREQFYSQIETNPPKIFVITDQWCLNLPGGYAKLAAWPEFSSFLNTNYSLAEQRVPQPWNHRYRATWPFGYRIYIRR